MSEYRNDNNNKVIVVAANVSIALYVPGTKVFINSCDPHNNPEVDTVVNLGKLRHRLVTLELPQPPR